MIACIVCRGTAATPVFREFEIDVLRCRACGHVFSSAIGEQDYDRWCLVPRCRPPAVESARRGVGVEDGCAENIYSRRTIAAVLRRNGFSTVRFVHLPPIQSLSGSRAPLLKAAKNAWYYSAVALSWSTRGFLSLDNLFVIAAKAA